MKRKYINILNIIEVMKRLAKGLTVEGSIYIDKETHVLTFKPYKRKKDKLLASLEHGWLKESPTCIKFYCALKKSIGTARMLCALEREQKVAAGHLMDREIVERV